MNKFIVFFIILFVALTGCTVEYFDDNDNVKYEYESELENLSEADFSNWTAFSSGLEIKQFMDENQNLITSVKIDNDKYKWAIAQADKPQNVNSWRNVLSADLVINGGYFDENNQSTGYLKVGSHEFGKFSSDGKNGYTGMLLIKNGKPELRYLPEKNFSKDEKITYGLQTFPTLVWNGIKKIEPGSSQTARRTVLAENENGQFYILISELFISLNDFADWMINSELNIDKAINLDGGTSTGIAIKTDERQYLVNSAPVPSVIYLKIR